MREGSCAKRRVRRFAGPRIAAKGYRNGVRTRFEQSTNRPFRFECVGSRRRASGVEFGRSRKGRRPAGSSGGVFVSEMNDVQRVRVTVNKSRTFRVDTAFATIVVSSSDIIDVKSLSDRLIYIQGKQTGTTNVILLDSSMKQIGILDVEVGIDTGNLQQNIRSGTGSHGIRVSSSEGQVVLSGMAADAVAAERAVAIATGSVARGGTVVNAMSVAAPQQVMLEVRFRGQSTSGA